MSNFKIYKVKKGDTLKSIAEQLNYTDSYLLKTFHNNHCPLHSLIGKDVYKGLDLLIPNENITNSEKPETRFLNKNQKLNFTSELLNTTYLVQITSYTGVNNKEEKQEISFNIQLTYKGKTDNKHRVEYKKYNFLIDGKVPNQNIDELAMRTSEILLPVEIVTDETAAFYTIHNIEAIQYHWQNEKEKLLEFYTDIYSKRYFEYIDSALKNPEYFIDYIKNEIYVQLLFPSFYGKYFTEDVLKQKMKLSVLPYSPPVLFNLSSFLDSQTNSHSFKITQEGESIDLRTQEEIELKQEIPFDGNENRNLFTVEYKTEYTLNPQCLINSIQSEFIYFISNRIRIDKYKILKQ